MFNFLTKERNGSVNLVVHVDEIRRGIRDLDGTGNNPAYLNRLKEALGECERVGTQSNSVQITHNFPDRISADIGNADLVGVYGCNRRACVEWVSEAALKAGARVFVSIKGTI